MLLFAEQDFVIWGADAFSTCANFEAYLKRGQISDGVESVITGGGRFGLAARGVVFTIVGIFLTMAALRFDSSEAAGLGGALQDFFDSPSGPATTA